MAMNSFTAGDPEEKYEKIGVLGEGMFMNSLSMTAVMIIGVGSYGAVYKVKAEGNLPTPFLGCLSSLHDFDY